MQSRFEPVSLAQFPVSGKNTGRVGIKHHKLEATARKPNIDAVFFDNCLSKLTGNNVGKTGKLDANNRESAFGALERGC
jgi:hypothetical protein